MAFSNPMNTFSESMTNTKWQLVELLVSLSWHLLSRYMRTGLVYNLDFRSETCYLHETAHVGFTQYPYGYTRVQPHVGFTRYSSVE